VAFDPTFTSDQGVPAARRRVPGPWGGTQFSGSWARNSMIRLCRRA